MIGTILVPVEGTSAMIAKALLEDTPSFAVDEEGNVPRAEEYGRKKSRKRKKENGSSGTLQEGESTTGPADPTRGSPAETATRSTRKPDTGAGALAPKGDAYRARAVCFQRLLLVGGARAWASGGRKSPFSAARNDEMAGAPGKLAPVGVGTRARAAECSIKGAAGQQTHVSTTHNYTGIDKCDWGQDGADPAERCRR